MYFFFYFFHFNDKWFCFKIAHCILHVGFLWVFSSRFLNFLHFPIFYAVWPKQTFPLLFQIIHACVIIIIFFSVGHWVVTEIYFFIFAVTHSHRMLLIISATKCENLYIIILERLDQMSKKVRFSVNTSTSFACVWLN